MTAFDFLPCGCDRDGYLNYFDGREWASFPCPHGNFPTSDNGDMNRHHNED